MQKKKKKVLFLRRENRKFIWDFNKLLLKSVANDVN